MQYCMDFFGIVKSSCKLWEKYFNTKASIKEYKSLETMQSRKPFDVDLDGIACYFSVKEINISWTWVVVKIGYDEMGKKTSKE